MTPDLDLVGPCGVVQPVPRGGTDASSFLHRVAWLSAFSGQFSSGITVLQGDSPVTVAASDVTAVLVDEVQYGLGEGPCMEAMDTGKAVHVRNQETDVRWGDYGTLAFGRGVRSSLSLPFLVEGAPTGALNLYDCRGPDGFDADTQKRLEVFALQAATAVALNQRASHHEQISDQVAAALRARSTIDQAIGILMAQEKCDAETALALLRRHSQTHNQKLREVATRLVERATGHPPSTPLDFAT